MQYEMMVHVVGIFRCYSNYSHCNAIFRRRSQLIFPSNHGIIYSPQSVYMKYFKFFLLLFSLSLFFSFLSFFPLDSYIISLRKLTSTLASASSRRRIVYDNKVGRFSKNTSTTVSANSVHAWFNRTVESE